MKSDCRTWSLHDDFEGLKEIDTTNKEKDVKDNQKKKKREKGRKMRNISLWEERGL